MNIYMDDLRLEPLEGNWTVIRRVEDVMPFLASGVVDHLSLDHDMGMCADCLAREGLVATLHCSHVKSGYDLCVWMEDTGHWPRYRPIIHSMDPVGRQRMAQAIAKRWDNSEAR